MLCCYSKIKYNFGFLSANVLLDEFRQKIVQIALSNIFKWTTKIEEC